VLRSDRCVGGTRGGGVRRPYSPGLGECRRRRGDSAMSASHERREEEGRAGETAPQSPPWPPLSRARVIADAFDAQDIEPKKLWRKLASGGYVIIGGDSAIAAATA
jgi:hypothetical protein